MMTSKLLWPFCVLRAGMRHCCAVACLGVIALGQFACEKNNDPAVNTAATPARPSVVGKGIEFSAAGNSAEYQSSGWSKAEDQFTWSEGTAAKLVLPIGPAPGALTLIAKIAAFVNPPELPAQPVEVHANGTKIAEWQVGDTADFRAQIPAAATQKGGDLLLEFRTPRAFSPSAAGKGDDPRLLGIALHRIELIPATAAGN